MFLRQLFIGRFWSDDDYDDDCADDDSDDDDYAEHDYFVYILISSCSSHITCFQEYSCEKYGMIFNYKGNYNYHRQICSGADGYICTKCGSIYKNKKG